MFNNFGMGDRPESFFQVSIVRTNAEKRHVLINEYNLEVLQSCKSGPGLWASLELMHVSFSTAVVN